MKIMDLQAVVISKLFWLVLILLGFALEATALYYQYVLQEPPCIVCIHVRLLIAAMIILATTGLFLRNKKVFSWIIILLLLLVFITMIDRSYQLLGTERGFFIGSCSMDLGFPAWFAIDKWLPWIFAVKTTCGYTPVIAFGITMAEALMGLSIVLALLATVLLLAISKRRKGLNFRGL